MRKRVRRPGRPVGVPEAVVDVHLAVDDLRAGVRRGVRAGHRRERARRTGTSQPTFSKPEFGYRYSRYRLEYSVVSWSGVAPSTSTLPSSRSHCCWARVFDRLEGRAVRDLLAQVVLRLVDADERGGQAERDGPVLARVEAQVALHPAGAALGDRRVEDAVHEEPGRARRQAGLHVRVAGERSRSPCRGSGPPGR